MRLSLKSTIKQPDGLIEIDVGVSNFNKEKVYTYILDSAYLYEKFLLQYRARRYGRALVILNKSKMQRK